jgi:hypothetical protein
VSLNRYLHSAGINLLKEEIESTTGLDMPNNPQWINENKAEERFNNKEIAFSSIIITVRTKAQAESYIARGIDFGGRTHRVERFWETGPRNICVKCCQYGHFRYNECSTSPKCYICAGDHEAIAHKCPLKGCTAKTGTTCIHAPIKCVNCDGKHLATSSFCPNRLKLVRKAQKERAEFYRLQKSREKIAVIIPRISRDILSTFPILEENRMDIEPQTPSEC